MKFNGTTATVTQWSSTSISVTVPAGATTGNVVVRVGGQDSNGQYFTVGAEEVQHYHTDALGSVRMVTRANQSVAARYDYLPFGQPWQADPASKETRRFAGLEWSPETGSGSWAALDYAGARYYHSQTARFTSPDPVVSAAALLNPQAWNRYAYALNNPLVFVDRNGKWPFYVHNGIYEAAFGGVLAGWQLNYLKQVSFNADFAKGAQAVSNSHAHSMCAGGQSVDACSGAIRGFIFGHLGEAHAESRGGQILSRRALWLFAHAVHALTDMGSPAHVADNGSPFTWSGGNREVLAHMFSERSSSVNWSRIGQSIRLAIAGFQQAFPHLAAQQGDSNAWANRAITQYVNDYFALYWAPDGGMATTAAAARACALGNPAACF